jgi:hypothetical protein
MAFGFSAKVAGRVPLIGAVSKKPGVPKSVQDIIDRAAASAMSLGPGGGNQFATSQTITPTTPVNQTPTTQSLIADWNHGAVGAGSPASVAPAGGGSGSVDPLNPQGSNAYSGWMSQFTPGSFSNEIWNDPQIILNAMWQQRGINPDSPLYSTMRSLNGVDPMSLDLLMNPGIKGGDVGDPQNYGNFLHSLYTSLMAPGGRAPNFNEMMATLGGTGDQSALDPKAQSALYQQLSQGGAPQQFRSYYALAKDAAAMGLSPNIASAFLDALARQGDRYLTNQAQGGTQPFFQYASNPMGR